MAIVFIALGWLRLENPSEVQRNVGILKLGVNIGLGILALLLALSSNYKEGLSVYHLVISINAGEKAVLSSRNRRLIQDALAAMKQTRLLD